MSSWGALGATLGFSALTLAVVFFAVWRVAVKRRDVSIIDILWGLAMVIVAAVSAIAGRGDGTLRGLLPGLTAAWGLRLAAYLAKRNLGHGEDARYTAIRNKIGADFDRWALGHIFGFQALAAWFISLPVQVGANLDASPKPWTWVGVSLWATGLVFESVGDAQLAAFKRDPGNAGKIMDRGLWRYTRHPNYFGDACVWWGIYVVAAANWIGALTILSPVVMTLMLVRVTGKELLERRLRKTRPGYEEYVARTSGFLPMPPRR